MRGADFAGAVVDPGLRGRQSDVLGVGGDGEVGADVDKLDGLDAYEQQLDSIVGNHYSADAGYVTGNINLWPRPLVIFMNHAALDALTADQQATLKEAAADTVGQALDDREPETPRRHRYCATRA